MKITINERDYRADEALTRLIHKKLSRIEKLFGDDAEAKVAFRKIKDTEILELTIYAHGSVFRTEVKGNDMHANVDAAMAKLCRQIDKHKSRFDDKAIKEARKEFNYFSDAEDTTPNAVVRRKRLPLTPMSIEDALVEIDLTNHDFYVYIDKEKGGVNVLYRRGDGNFGVIETE
jgi:putative sigma-54 modulation protein